MVTVSISIPQMDNIPAGAPQLYLWLAYLWADIHTLSTGQAEVFVPPLLDCRSINQDSSPDSSGGIAIPAGDGTIQLNVDDGGFGIGGAGVVILLFERHDTPDDAMNAGYDAFGPALQQQVDAFLKTGALQRPTDQQIAAIIKGVSDAVTAAVSSKLSIWDKLFGTQDRFVGYSQVVFAGESQLQIGEGSGIPNIAHDPPNAYGHCSFPGGNVLVVKTVSEPCSKLEAAVQAAITNLKDLTTEISSLEEQLATADHLQRQEIMLEIGQLKKRIPGAQAALTRAQKELQICRITTGLGTVIQGSKRKTHPDQTPLVGARG